MIDLLKLLACALTKLFRLRVRLEAEILVLRHQLNVLRRKAPPVLSDRDLRLASFREKSFQVVDLGLGQLAEVRLLVGIDDDAHNLRRTPIKSLECLLVREPASLQRRDVLSSGFY